VGSGHPRRAAPYSKNLAAGLGIILSA
jgi:hypothetical protein